VHNGGHGLSLTEAERLASEAEFQIKRGLVPALPRDEIVELSPAPLDPQPQGTMQRPDDPYGAFVFDLFQQLVAHKALPKYQFERRIDAIVALFLPEIIRDCLGWNVRVVVPEFPIKKASNNQSTNVDCLLFREGGRNGERRAWVFFELKTDHGSTRAEQWDIYCAAAKRGMPRLCDDLRTIANASNQPEKYREMLALLQGYETGHPVEIVYLSPGSRRPLGMPSDVHSISFAQLGEAKPENYAEVWHLFRQIVLPRLC